MVYALMIDDEQALRESVQRTASLAGLELLTASTWDEGLTLFHIHSPDLVIVDYNLPESRHGLQLIAEIRKLRPSVRLVLLSGYIDEEDAQEIESLDLVDRAVSKITSPNATELILNEIRSAAHRALNPTNWVDVATAHQRAESTDRAALDDLDHKIQQRRGMS